MVEITDRESLEAWLEGQSREVAVVIAARSAMRVMPLLSASFESDLSKEEQSSLIVSSFQCNLISSVFALGASDEMSAAAHVAYSRAANAATPSASARAAIFTTNAAHMGASAAHAVHAAANSAAAAYGGVSDLVWNAVERDVNDLQGGASPEEMMGRPLWRRRRPLFFEEDHGRLMEWLEAEPGFAFWGRWYRAVEAGQPMNWDMQREIALIPDDIWEAGAGAVSEEIERIEANYFEKVLPQAERIERDEDTGKYSVSTIMVDPDVLLENALKQAEFALDAALGSNVSGFNRMCMGYKYLQHALEQCRDDPNTVEQHFGLARKLIEAKLESGEYQSDDGLSALTISLERHEVQLRADHPEVRRAWETRALQRMRDVDEETRAQLADGFVELGDGSKDRLKDEFELDADLVRSNAEPEVAVDAIKRSGGRGAKIAAMEKAGNLAKKVDGSGANKAAGLAFRAQKLVELLSGFF